MSNFLPKSVRNLIEEFSRLPGIGPKSAQRLAIYLLHSPDMKVRGLGDAISGLKENVVFCEQCWNIAEENPCKVCSSPERDKSVICVVEDVLDTVAIERTGDFQGVYHVLHGVLSPVDGIGPDQLKFESLFDRVKGGVDEVNDNTEDGETGSGENGGGESGGGDSGSGRTASVKTAITELIIATNPSLEGEATALYIQRHLQKFCDGGLKITRIARGLPVGGDLEYADEVTLSRALKGRVDF